MKRLRVGVVGVGHLGKEHARILAGMPDVELVGVADTRAAQAQAVAERCGARAFVDHLALLPHVAAAVVAVPTAGHHAVARDFLAAGVPVLVEKPLAATPAEAAELVALARARGAVLQVGHVERFNPAFEELQRRPLRPKYVACQRCGGYTGRSTDVGAVLDLMIHDLDLVLALVRAPAVRVEAMGVAVLGGHEDVAQARVTFADGCVADLTASRVHPAPLRRMQAWGPEGYAGVDFAARRLTLMQPAEALRQGRVDPAALFGRYVQTAELDCNDATGDALTRELRDFVGCVRRGGAPRVDGAAGHAALELAGRVLDGIAAHSWDGRAGGPAGPHALPAPRGALFAPPAREQAA